MSRIGTILVICTGNVCRSPYIERRLEAELVGTGITLSSAGTRALVGRHMDAGSRAMLEQAGVDAGGFVARQLTSDLVAGADLVITAAREHRATAARLAPAALRRIFTLRDLGDLLHGIRAEELHAVPHEEVWVRQVGSAAASRRGMVPARQTDVDITDPIGQSLSVFEQMAAEVDAALTPVVAALRMGGTE